MRTKLESRYPSIYDVVSRMDKDGNLNDIVEVLNETNEMLQDIVWTECNQGMNHVTTVRSGLPNVAWRKLNYGVQPSKSTTKKIQDSCGMMEAFAVVDKKLLELYGMSSAWRMSENEAFVEAMNQEFQRAIFKGDTKKDPEKFLGLEARYSTVNKKNAENAINVIDAGGTGNNLTSIWLICWGPQAVQCIYPKNSPVGLKNQDLGEESATDPDGGEYRVMKTHFSWDVGLTVRDWRYCVRIANVDITKLTENPNGEGGNAKLFDLLSKALFMLPSMKGKIAFYMNRDIMYLLDAQMRNHPNVQLTVDQVGTQPVMKYKGVPLRRVDALTCDEKQVQ